jgi:CMP-N-acetylneuraminic acid synthetase
MIAYSIAAAKSCPFIKKIVVTTDDEEVGEIAEKYGALVHYRPKDLSGDTELSRVMANVLAAYYSEAVVEFYPTCPIRTPKMVMDIVGYLATGRYYRVWTARRDTPTQQMVGLGSILGHRLDGNGKEFMFYRVDEPFTIDVNRITDFSRAEQVLGLRKGLDLVRP